jgi:hypothetical protein
MPPLFLLLLAHHWVYLWFPVLILFLVAISRLAEIPAEGIASPAIAGQAVSLAAVLDGDKLN